MPWGEALQVLCASVCWHWTSQSSQESLPSSRVRFEHCSGVLPSFLETHFGTVCGKAPSHTTDPVSYMDSISPFLVSSVLLSFYCSVQVLIQQCEALGSIPRYWKTERQNREYICYFRSFSLVSFQFNLSFMCLPACLSVLFSLNHFRSCSGSVSASLS